MKNCEICGTKRSFTNSFEYEGKLVCRECLNRLYDTEQLICSNCGYQGIAETTKKGSFGISCFLWLSIFIFGAINLFLGLIFLVLALVYTSWRIISKYSGCPQCKATNMIGVNSPIGKKIIRGLEE